MQQADRRWVEAIGQTAILACSPSLHPRLAECLSLHQHQLSSFFLLIWWVFVLTQNAFHHQPQFGADAIAVAPIHSHVLPQTVGQLNGECRCAYGKPSLGYRDLPSTMPITLSTDKARVKPVPRFLPDRSVRANAQCRVRLIRSRRATTHPSSKRICTPGMLSRCPVGI